MRKCIICGEDISHLRSHAKLCGKKTCENAYRKIRKKQPKVKRYCIICGEDITHLAPQRKICDKIECRKTHSRNHYQSHLIEKTCSKCGKIFFGTGKQVCCDVCSKKKDILYETIERPILCKYCGKIITYETVNKTYKTNPEGKPKVCDECKKNTYIRFSNRMKVLNPSFDPEIATKSGNKRREIYEQKCISKGEVPKPKYVYKGESKEEMVLRMKTNNPMHNPESRNKMIKTLTSKYENGEIVKHFGKDNWNWKGNRNFNYAVRTSLRKWVREMMEKQNFICEKCGKNKTELHVHHLIPLRDIINNTLNELNLTLENLRDIEGTTEYFSIIQQIVDYHYNTENVGIVVCPECHTLLDKFYRRKTHENRKNYKNKEEL